MKATASREQQLTVHHAATHKLAGGAGAQALVAWSLQQSLPDQPFAMVAEEDAKDLRYPVKHDAPLQHDAQ